MPLSADDVTYQIKYLI